MDLVSLSPAPSRKEIQQIPIRLAPFQRIHFTSAASEKGSFLDCPKGLVASSGCISTHLDRSFDYLLKSRSADPPQSSINFPILRCICPYNIVIHDRPNHRDNLSAGIGCLAAPVYLSSVYTPNFEWFTLSVFHLTSRKKNAVNVIKWLLISWWVAIVRGQL
jgi:hypothetical protein